MNKEKKVGDVLAVADFRLSGTGYNGEPVYNTIRAELQVSGAFQYGNQTCMVFEWDNAFKESFDTRYEDVTPETFTEFAKRVIEDRVLGTVKVEVTEFEDEDWDEEEDEEQYEEEQYDHSHPWAVYDP